MTRRRRQQTFQKEVILAGLLLVLMSGLASNLQSNNLGLKLQSLAFLALLLIGGAGFWLWKLYRQEQHAQKMLALAADQIDNLPPLVFERTYLPALLQKVGYFNVQSTPYNDFGIDLVATKDIKYGIQVKHMAQPHKKRISLKAVQEVVAGVQHRNYRGCPGMMVITNGYFTKSAQELAVDCGCLLVDREKLAEWIVRSRLRPK